MKIDGDNITMTKEEFYMYLQITATAMEEKLNAEVDELRQKLANFKECNWDNSDRIVSDLLYHIVDGDDVYDNELEAAIKSVTSRVASLKYNPHEPEIPETESKEDEEIPF